jgi:hypothetical protein
MRVNDGQMFRDSKEIGMDMGGLVMLFVYGFRLEERKTTKQKLVKDQRT